jgi:hypothetical protein
MGNCGLACEVDGGGREMVYSKTNQKALGSSKRQRRSVAVRGTFVGGVI